MSTAASAVTVEKQATVDIKKPETQVVEGEHEETMAEYAARREAEMRGEKPQVKQTVVVEPTAEEAAAAEAKKADEAAAAEKAAADKKAEAAKAEEHPEELIDEAHPAKKGISKRMGELTAARKTAEDEAAAAKKEAAEAKAEAERVKAELEAAKKAAEERPVVPKVEDDPAPTRDAFDDPDEYQAAYTAHAARQEIRKANEAAETQAKTRREADAKKLEDEQKAAALKAVTKLHEDFNANVAKTKDEYPDYDAKVTNNEKLILRNDIFFTVEKSPMAAHLLYYLSDHPDEAASLNNMHPIDAAMRLGEIQADIRIARKPKVSNAADPVRPVRSRSSPERKTPDEETMEEYAARREREEADKRAAARRRAH